MSDSRRRIYQFAGVLTTTVALIALLVAVLDSSSPSPLLPGKPVPGARSAATLFAGVPQNGIVLGSASAPLTLVEFGDLQCPYCAYFATHALPTLVSRYVRGGRLRLVFRNVDGLGHDSVRAARMAAALGEQNHLWEFVDLAYRNQREENSGYVSDNFLRAIAGVIPGVDVARAMSQRSSATVTGQIAQAMSMAKTLHLKVTPSFLLFATGQPQRRFQPDGLGSSSFTSVIDKMLSRLDG